MISEYIITEKKTEETNVAQQGKQITGVVMDAFGPVIGANIVEKGTMNGVISDSEGRIVLNVAPGATLIISYIAYISQEIKITDQTSYTITLHEDTETLEEVVVVGYGTMKKKDLTGAVKRVNLETLRLFLIQVYLRLLSDLPLVSIPLRADMPERM